MATHIFYGTRGACLADMWYSHFVHDPHSEVEMRLDDETISYNLLSGRLAKRKAQHRAHFKVIWRNILPNDYLKIMEVINCLNSSNQPTDIFPRDYLMLCPSYDSETGAGIFYEVTVDNKFQIKNLIPRGIVQTLELDFTSVYPLDEIPNYIDNISIATIEVNDSVQGLKPLTTDTGEYLQAQIYGD
ncbi:MAG: hypothetical protein RBR14_06490 [Candidatus Cloacimonas acidaminovorans]|nr:hypothetical protein [Candidatus Cloacimonas acidaminovorans]